MQAGLRITALMKKGYKDFDTKRRAVNSRVQGRSAQLKFRVSKNGVFCSTLSMFKTKSEIK